YMGLNYIGKKSKWRNGKSEEVLKQIDKDIPEILFAYAVDFDKLGFESKNNELREYAYKLYTIYVKNVPKGPSLSDARYNIAAIQMERQQYEAAAKNLARILTTDKKVKDKNQIAALMVQSSANAIATERQGY